MGREIQHLKGLDLIVEERLRQVEKLGYTVEHDHEHHSPTELMKVGYAYIEWALNDLQYGPPPKNAKPGSWPETDIPWKPESSSIENASKGAAFVAAALDLLYAQVMGEV